MNKILKQLPEVLEQIGRDIKTITVVLDTGHSDKGSPDKQPTTNGQISLVSLQTTIPSPINYPENEAKLASGDYVVDTNNNELIIQVGKQYAGWTLDADDTKKVDEEGLLKLQNYVSSNSSGETANITLKSPVKVASVLYNSVREVDLNKFVSVTDFTYKFENNVLSELKLHGVLENGKAVSRYLNKNTDYIQILQHFSAGYGTILDSVYGGKTYNNFFSQNGEKPIDGYSIPEDVTDIDLTVGHYSFSKTINLRKEPPRT